jgi:hypothetical protein
VVRELVADGRVIQRGDEGRGGEERREETEGGLLAVYIAQRDVDRLAFHHYSATHNDMICMKPTPICRP